MCGGASAVAPSPLHGGSLVAAVRDALHAQTGERFDCVLCNLYPAGGESACKFHTDPEHGTLWARPTTVVSVGETRRFCFRPLRRAGSAPPADEARFTVPLFTGDVVTMVGRCNDDYEHSVLPAQGERNTGARVSLVFKRALPRRDGKRGHSLQGEGRRGGRKRTADAQPGGAATPDSERRVGRVAGATTAGRGARRGGAGGRGRGANAGRSSRSRGGGRGEGQEGARAARGRARGGASARAGRR